eukprot:365644-Chlamydomonas_euryale.AAC.9
MPLPLPLLPSMPLLPPPTCHCRPPTCHCRCSSTCYCRCPATLHVVVPQNVAVLLAAEQSTVLLCMRLSPSTLLSCLRPCPAQRCSACGRAQAHCFPACCQPWVITTLLAVVHSASLPCGMPFIPYCCRTDAVHTVPLPCGMLFTPYRCRADAVHTVPLPCGCRSYHTAATRHWHTGVSPRSNHILSRSFKNGMSSH